MSSSSSFGPTGSSESTTPSETYPPNDSTGASDTDVVAESYRADDLPAGSGIGVTTSSSGSTGAGTDAGWPPESGSQTSSTSSSTADVAKNEAANVKDTAVDAGKNVAATAKGEAANVVQETKQQAQSLLSTVTSEVRDQGRNQQQRIATAVTSLSKELGGMASGEPQSGPLTDLAQQASRKGEEIGRWLENREPSDVLEEVKRFARRRPVMFLGLCALAGVVVGRLARGAVAANTSLDTPDSDSDSRALTAQTYPSNYETPATYESSTYTSTYPTSYPATGAAVGDTPSTYETTSPSTYSTTSEPVYDDPSGRPDVTR